MLSAVLFVLWGVLAVSEVRASRPEGDLQEVDHFVLVLERVDQLERKFDEGRRQCQTEKQHWQKEKRQWQKEKEDWQKEKQDWQKEKLDWQKEKLDWQKERRDWQKEKQDWQKEKRVRQKEKHAWKRKTDQSEHLNRQMQNQSISLPYNVDILQTRANSHKSRPATPQTPHVFTQAAVSSKMFLAKSSQKRHVHHVLARSDDINPLEFVVSQMGQRLRQVTAEVHSLKNALEQDVNKMGQHINEVTAEVQSLKNSLEPEVNQMSQSLSDVTAEVQFLKNSLEPEVNQMSQNLSDVTAEVQSLKNSLEPEVNQMSQNLSHVTREVQSVKNILEPEINQMSQNLSEVTAEVQSLKNTLEPEVNQISQHLSDVTAEVQFLKNTLEPEVNQMSQNLSEVTAEVQSLKTTLEPEVNQMSQTLSEVTAEVQSLKTTLEPEVNQMSQTLSEVTAEVQSMKNANSQQDQAIQQAGTSTFVRWGRSVCPSSTELVYSGVAGGAWYDDGGSTTTAFCLPLNPVLASHYKPSEYDWMCGAEYQTDHHSYQRDPVCSVCRTPRPTTIMVPATKVCEDGWTLEYSGYLMGSNPKDPASHEAVCMDTAFENRPGSGANQNGLLFYFMFTYCGSLPCPPYQGNKLVTCAVCSK